MRAQGQTRFAFQLAGGLLVLFVAAAAVLLVARRGGEREALRSMPPAERASLYAKTWAAFTELCSSSPPADLEGRCREQASLLRQFPECDAGCRDATARWLAQPTR